MKNNNKLLACPYIIWMVLFTIIPLGIVVYYALTDSITGQFTLSNLSGMGTYLPIFLRSIWLSLFASLICLVIGYPVAYFIAQCKPLTQRFLEMLIMLPMCMSFLLRTLAWVAMLEDTGIINNFIRALGLSPLPLIRNNGAVILGMVYNYLPYMILPLYTVIMKIDRRLIEAASDLGCTPSQVFTKVILPLSGPNQAYGRRILDGVALAADELNNGPGIDGRTVELLTYDTQSNPDTAVERVREAVRDGAVAAVAGYNSTELDAMDGVLRRRRLPAITPMATIDGLTEQNPFLFRSSFTDSQQGHALAAYAWYWRKLLRLGVIMNMEPDDEYSRSVARETAQAFKDLGGTVVRTVEFSGESKDLVPTLRSLLTAGPQAIVVPTETA